MFENYERIRANLLVFKRPIDTDQIQDDPYIQQLQSTINLYQDLYLTLVEELEKVRLARLQETPNVIQIEQATIPEKPVRPIPILYTAVSGVVGIMLAVLLVFLIETLRNEQEAPDIDLLPNSEKGTRGTEKVSSERSIADLELGKRATDALAKAGIIKVGQFITKLAEGEDVLLAVSGFSQISLIDAKKKLRALGYKIPRQ
jgi:hypothetical protein